MGSFASLPEIPEFKTNKILPPLSPERLAELVSASPNSDDNSFARHWITGEYENPVLEATYRIFHLKLWAPRVRLMFGTIAISMLISLHAGSRNEVASSSNRHSVPIDAHSDTISDPHTCSVDRAMTGTGLLTLFCTRASPVRCRALHLSANSASSTPPYMHQPTTRGG